MKRNQDVKSLLEFDLRTDCVIKARRPDIVLIETKNKETFIIGVTIPGDCRAREKEAKKLLKYQTLVLEISRM